MEPVENYAFFFPADLMLIWHLVAFVTGCCVGSFLNVCIWRIPQNMSLSSPPSHCPKCNHKIPWYENIPLLSWIALRGRCSSCHEPISSRYFLVELLVGILFYLLWFKIILDKQPISLLVLYWVVTAFIVAMAFIDFDHRVIPDRLTYPLLFFGIAYALIFPGLWGTESILYAGLMAIGTLLGVTLLMALFATLGEHLFKQEALGWGDVKYMAAVGACLGPKACFITLLAGSLIGSVYGVTMLAFRKGKLHSALPFGPFLAIGTFLTMLYAERMQLIYQFLIHRLHF